MLATLIKRAGGVAAGTAVGQGLVLLATPLLARRFTPAEFGALALLATVTNVCSAAACLRYDMAIPSSTESDTKGLMRVAIAAAAALGFGAWLGLAIASDGLFGARVGVLATKPVLVGLCVMLVGAYQATNALLLRRGAFRAVAGLRMSQGAGFSAFAFVPGVGLLWAQVLSFGAGLVGLGASLSPRTEADAGWIDVARRHKDFPLLSLPGALLDVCGYSVCVWVVATVYGPGAAGKYSQILRLTGAPLMLASISLGQILLRQTAEISSEREVLRAFFGKILKLMAGLAGASLVILWFFGVPAFALLLGPKWDIDRTLIMSVAAAVFVRACVSPLSTVLITLRRFGTALIWQTLYFCSALLLMPLVAARVEFSHFMMFYAVHECIFYIFYLILTRRAIRLVGRNS